MNNEKFKEYPLNFTFMDDLMMDLVFELNNEWENIIEQQLKLMPKDKN